MHYPRDAFGSPVGAITITPTNPAAQIGQRTSLSAGDIAGVRAMYPACGGVAKPPSSDPLVFKKAVDDERRPFKKIIDDNRFKKVRDDVIPKILRDPIPGPRFPNLPRFGALQPFSLATTHHASFEEGSGAESLNDPNVAAYVSGVEQQLLELEAAIAEARAQAARANADAARLQAESTAMAADYEQVIGKLGGGGT